MKQLEFTSFNRELFEMMYEGLLVTRLPLDNRGVKRLHGKLLDKMEAIGKRKAKPDDLLFTLAGDSGVLELEDAESDHLAKAIAAVVWVPLSVRKGNDLEDFIEASHG